MHLIHAAAVALNQTPLDWTGNLSRIRHALARAREAGASLVCLPELCITGYGCEDAFFAPGTHERAWSLLMDLLPDTKGLIVAVGLPIFHRSGLFNACAVIADGKLLGLAAKKTWRAMEFITNPAGSNRGPAASQTRSSRKTMDPFPSAILSLRSAASASALKFAKMPGSRIARAPSLQHAAWM